MSDNNKVCPAGSNYNEEYEDQYKEFIQKIKTQKDALVTCLVNEYSRKPKPLEPERRDQLVLKTGSFIQLSRALGLSLFRSEHGELNLVIDYPQPAKDNEGKDVIVSPGPVTILGHPVNPSRTLFRREDKFFSVEEYREVAGNFPIRYTITFTSESVGQLKIYKRSSIERQRPINLVTIRQALYPEYDRYFINQSTGKSNEGDYNSFIEYLTSSTASDAELVEYLASNIDNLNACEDQKKAFMEVYNTAPTFCITEEEVKEPELPPQPTTPKPPEQEIDPCIKLPAEKWGVRFRYNVNTGTNSAACIEGPTREQRALGTFETHTSTYEQRDWFLSLLPAMKSVFPGQMDTPNAMPGLQFRIFSNIAKHRVPGFQPIYQHMGVEALYITMVGTFTGDGGLGKVTEVTESKPVDWEIESQGVLEGSGNYNMTPVPILPEGTDPNTVLTDQVTDIRRRATFTVKEGKVVIAYRNTSMKGQAIRYPSGSKINFTGSVVTDDQGVRWFEIEPGFLYVWIVGIRDSLEEGSQFESLDELEKFLITSSSDIRDAIGNNPNNYSLYKVTSDRVKLYKEANAGTETSYLINKGETVLVVEFKDSWAYLSSGYWVHRSHIRPITISPLDNAVSTREIIPSNYLNGQLFDADGCVGTCPDPLDTSAGKEKSNLVVPYTQPSFPAKTPLYQIAAQLDAYHEFVSFYKLAVQQGNELEIEVNTRKYDDGLTPRQGLDDDPLRDRANGNPKFKGYLKKMEVYHARTDRTWYLMEFEVTDHSLAGTQAINLTHEIEGFVNEALIYQEEEQRSIEEEQRQQVETNQPLRDLVKLYTKQGGIYNGKIYVLTFKSSVSREARRKGTVRTVEIESPGVISFRTENALSRTTVRLSEEEFRSLPDADPQQASIPTDTSDSNRRRIGVRSPMARRNS